MVQMTLYSLVQEEIDAQQELVSEGRFKPLIIQQGAFFESFLEFNSQLAFQQQKEAPLSNNEMSAIEGMGHADRIRLAHLFGVIDEEEHGHLQSMASLRNKLAHLPWGQIDGDGDAGSDDRLASLPEVCGDVAVYVNPEQTGDIARGIEVVLQDAQIAKKCRVSGRDGAVQFTWKAAADQFVTVAHDVVSG